MGDTLPTVSDLTVSERRAICLEMRKLGNTQQEIANETGLTVNAVSKLISDAIERNRRIENESAKAIMFIELQRLDFLQKGLMDRFSETCDPIKKARVSDAITNVMDSRARYLGLYKPEELNVRSIVSPEELISRIVERSQREEESAKTIDDEMATEEEAESA